MKLSKHQYGASLWSVIFTLFLIGFIAFTALKLFPVYMEDFSIESSLQSLEADIGAEYRGAMSVRNAVSKRLSVNNVKVISRDDVSVTRDGQAYNVTIDYQVTVPFIGNISLLVTFNHSVAVRASV